MLDTLLNKQIKSTLKAGRFTRDDENKILMLEIVEVISIVETGEILRIQPLEGGFWRGIDYDSAMESYNLIGHNQFIENQLIERVNVYNQNI